MSDFNSTTEIYEYLILGGSVKRISESNVVIKLDENGNMNSSYSFYDYTNWIKYSFWVEDIQDKYILCWVGSTNPNEKKQIDIVFYCEKYNCFLPPNAVNEYKFATPLSQDEISCRDLTVLSQYHYHKLK